MASIELGYVRADAAFAERLRADLARHALEVTLREWPRRRHWWKPADPDVDFTCVVWSGAAAAHPRAAAEIARAVARENGTQGAAVLPLLIESIPLPEELAHRRCAVFAAAYETGLAELLPTFGRIAVLRVCEQPELDVKVLSARRGIAKRFGSFTLDDGITPVSAVDSHRIRMVAGFTLRGNGIMAMIESVGDPAHTPEFTELVAAQVLDAFTGNEIEPTNESFSRFFTRVDKSARLMSTERGLRRSRRLSCRLALAVRLQESIYWAAAGPVSVLVRCQGADDTSTFGIFQERGTYGMNPDADDNEALHLRAPLGYTVDLALEVQRVPFRVEGDYCAMSSFALPRQQDECRPLVMRLSRYRDPAQIVRALAAWHEPLFEDCDASVMYRVR